MSSLMNTFGKRTLTLVKGEGSRVWDDKGNSYLDGISGIATCCLGYSHPTVTAALCKQAAEMIHVSNLYDTPQQLHLADLLVDVSGMDQVFFANSGTEANEAAIKIARKFANDNGRENASIIVMEHSFHGRTLGALAATGNDKVQKGFHPLLSGFIRVPYDDVAAVENAIKANGNVVAILVEPIQGEGGVHVPAEGYLKELRRICDENDMLLMLDEIQSGNGRTGKYFAYQHEGILPDVVTTAKGLGNGFPIGACLARGRAAQVFQPGNHGTTFGGNPLACSVAIAVIETLTTTGIIDRAGELGHSLLREFKAALGNNPKVVDIRGKGLMIGIQLDKDCPELVERARNLGLLINVTAGSTIRLLPTLILTDDEAKELVSKVVQLVTEF